MIGRFQAYEQAKKQNLPPPDWGRQGVLFGLAATFDTPSPEWVATRPEHEELRLKLALVKTTFARFDRELCLPPARLPRLVAGRLLDRHLPPRPH